MVAKPAEPLECLSADWGPTGLWALVNVKQNRGISWESPPVHNGHFTWGDPARNIFGCETFSEHRDLRPGEMLEMEQTFTILRDAKTWCEHNNISLPFEKSSAGREQGKWPRVTLRPLSKAENWHRRHGLYFSG